MKRLRIALATSSKRREPDNDDELLLAAIRARVVHAEMLTWDDPRANTSAFDACVIQSTCRYHDAVPEFLAWAERVSSVTRLWNPLPVVQWNIHKRYLCELAARGVPTVPTAWIEQGGSSSLRDALEELGAHEAVVTPAISTSFDAIRVQAQDVDGRAEEHVAQMRTRCDVMVQPYVRSVGDYGERSLVWIDGAFTHAIRRSPGFSGDAKSVSAALPIAEDERVVAMASLEAVGHPKLYGRVDLARDDNGAPMIVELKLVEPSLFLNQSPSALARFADAILGRASRSM